MKRMSLLVVCVFAVSSWVTSEEKPPFPSEVIQAYLRLEPPDSDMVYKNRPQRLQVLHGLQAYPDQAVQAVAATLPKLQNQIQRAELVEALGRIHTRASADVLVTLLNDPNDPVRYEAIRGLWTMACRTDRIAGTRTIRRDNLEPKVKGLVPHLIAAASDPVEGNRKAALYALAGAREPAAVVALRAGLADPSEKVRSTAACLLTEFHDASGLPEMKRALERLRTKERGNDIVYLEAEMLLASFERITGKSFGPIPGNPLLCSHLDRMREAEKRYWELMDTWAGWWAWEPTLEGHDNE